MLAAVINGARECYLSFYKRVRVSRASGESKRAGEIGVAVGKRWIARVLTLFFLHFNRSAVLHFPDPARLDGGSARGATHEAGFIHAEWLDRAAVLYHN